MNQSTSIPNYFEFYDLPVQFFPDQEQVKAKFYALSKQYHPDFYANAGEDKQAEALEQSTLNNKAYQTLSHAQKRLKYVLELKGVVVEEEGYQLPQSFLMEMMDVNEALMDLEFEPDPVQLAKVRAEVDGIEKQISDELHQLMTSHDAHPEDAAEILPAIKDLFYRQKYIDRIRERLPRG